MYELDERLAVMDRQGVDMQMLAIPPILYYYDQPPSVGAAIARAANDHLVRQVNASPDRFVVAGTLPMQDPQLALQELHRIVDIPEVQALQIGSHIDGRNLDESDFGPVWGAIADAGLAVIIHPYHVAGADRMKRHYLWNLIGNPNDSTIAIGSLILGGVLERLPTLKIVLVHGGGCAPYLVGRWDHAWEARDDVRALTNKLPSETLRSCYFDSLTHDTESLRFLGTRFGWEHVLLGSDYPFDMADDDPVSSVRKLGLSEAQEHRVLALNAESFLAKGKSVSDGIGATAQE